MSASIWEPGSSVPVVDPNSEVKSQIFTATAGQTLFNITLFTYNVGANAIEVFRNGLKLPSTSVTETSSASFTLAAQTGGETIEVVGNVEVASASNSAAAASASASSASTSASTATTKAAEALASANAAAASAAVAFMTWRGAWVTATAYVLNNGVSINGASYVCVSAHTSGTFATDLAGAKWQLLARAGVDGTGSGDMLKANNLSDLANAVTARSNLGLGSAATQAAGAFATAAHTQAASSITNTPAGNIAATDVQAAIDELATEKAIAGNVPVDTHAATSKVTPVDADEIPLVDSAASFGLKKLTWANLKATLKAYFDTLYYSVTTQLNPRNGIINGGFRVQQGPNATLSATAQYVLDQWQTFCSGTGISGTIGQAVNLATVSNYGLGVTGASWTSGYLLSRTRLEGKDTTEYSGRSITISGMIYHDFGSTTNFSLSLTKANALDNFATQTQIGSTPTVACASGAYTPFSVTYALGATDGDTGLEFAVYSAVVTVANKNVYIGDIMLTPGTVALPFTQPSVGAELALCQRYYETGTLYYEFTGPAGGVSAGTNSQFKVEKRVTPTMAFGTFANLQNTSVGATRTARTTGFDRYAIAISAAVATANEPWTASARL